MDNDKIEIMALINNDLTSSFSLRKIGDIKYDLLHFANINISDKYDDYTIKDFIALYRMDCLLEKGLINEKDHECLVKMLDTKRYFEKLLQEELSKKFNNLDVDDKEIGKLKKHIERLELFLSLHHLLDDIDLKTLIYKEIEANSESQKKKIK